QGWALFISTPNGFNWFHKLYERARRLPDWACWQRPSTDNPDVTADELANARAEGELVYAQEYLAQFLDFALIKPFRLEWLQEWESHPLISELYVVIGVDPAISKRDEASQTAVVVAGRPLRGLDRTVAYILQADAGHWSPYDTASRLLTLARTWGAR